VVEEGAVTSSTAASGAPGPLPVHLPHSDPFATWEGPPWRARPSRGQPTRGTGPTGPSAKPHLYQLIVIPMAAAILASRTAIPPKSASPHGSVRTLSGRMSSSADHFL